MTLADWAAYYVDPHRDKVKNVISLEVSESPLAAQVEAPQLVRQLDWVEQIWPKDLKKPDTYPRVQKYCLMSVENCWTVRSFLSLGSAGKTLIEGAGLARRLCGLVRILPRAFFCFRFMNFDLMREHRSFAAAKCSTLSARRDRKSVV